MMDIEMQQLINELHNLTLNEIYVYLNVVAKCSAWKTMTNKYVLSYNMQENIYLIFYSKEMIDIEMQCLINELYNIKWNIHLS